MHCEPEPSSNVVSLFRTECLEQAERLAELFERYAADREIRAEIEDLRKTIPLSLPVLWLGMGASWCSTLAGAAWLSMLGRASFAVEASEWLHFSIRTKAQVSGPILVTTSGESAELVELVRRDVASPGILLCNNSGSTCWRYSQIRLPILAGTERANATKTFTNSTAACAILASELAKRDWQQEAECVVQRFTRNLERVFGLRKELEDFCHRATSVEMVARGPAFSGATMGALCFREMTGIRAAAHSGGGFRHGPLLDVDSTHVAVILALGRTAELGRNLARDCLRRGGRVVLVESSPGKRADQLFPVELEPVPEPWESLTSVLVSQALTLAFIERVGSRYVRAVTTVQ